MLAPGGPSGGDGDARQTMLYQKIRAKHQQGGGGGNGGNRNNYAMEGNNIIKRAPPPPPLDDEQQPSFYIPQAPASVRYGGLGDDSGSVMGGGRMMMGGGPMVSDEEMEQRRAEWYIIRHNKDKEGVEAESNEVIESNMQQLEKQANNANFSRVFLESMQTAHVPCYCSRIHHTDIHVELADSPRALMEWKPQYPLQAFGSLMDYAQGFVVPPLSSKDGILDNTYLIRLALKDVVSTFPVALGVLIGEKTGERGKEFVPYNLRGKYTEVGHQLPMVENRGDEADIGSYHAIIRPFHNGEEELVAYASRNEINEPLAMQYPHVTSDPRTITGDTIIQNGASYNTSENLVPRTSIVLHHLFSYCPWLQESDKPTISGDKQGYYKVKKRVYDKAVNELSLKIQTKYPVRNLKQFAIRLYPLTEGPFANDALLRELTRREKELNTTPTTIGTVGTKGAYKNDQEARASLNRFAVSFKVAADVMFRNYAATSVDVGDEGDQQFNDD
jgi:hypothetical protein